MESGKLNVVGLKVKQCCIVVYRLGQVVVTQAVQIASNSYGKSRKGQTHVDNRMPAPLESCTAALETNKSLSYQSRCDSVKGK